jgi:Domain of unknown function (DUF222)
MAQMIREHDDPAGVLSFAREQRSAADRAEALVLTAAVEWAAMHAVDSVLDAAPGRVSYGECAVAIAGPGAPLVAEFAIAELAAALGLSPDAGRGYLGEAVELRYRLPRLWRRVAAGELAAWKARRIAAATIALSREAAGFVDAHVAHVAHRIGPFQLARLVEEAITRCMPGEVERRRRAAAEGRHLTVDTRNTSLAGTTAVWGELDTADALDLDAAVAAGAEQLKALGSTDSLDVRRAATIGELARHQQTLDLNPDTDTDTDTDAADGAVPRRTARQVVLYVHLSDAAVTTGGLDGLDHQLGRLENTRTLVTAEQVRSWCGASATQVVVKPVIDLAEHVHVSAYEVPDRMVEAAALVDVTCVFPWCTRPARGCRAGEQDADCDHITPHGRGAPTCSCNIAPLCRRHHRLKTHGGWRYTPVERGTYLWTSPLGLSFLRDHDGTLDVTPEHPTGPVRACAHPPDS